jgi:hypothetical protein
MSKQDLLLVAKAGGDINLAIKTFTEIDMVLKILEPFGYVISNLSSYVGSKPNCKFIKR